MEIKGLLYFPVDIHFLESDTMLLLANDYGLEATSIVMHLLSRIYANGYYIQWDERRCKVFAASLPTKTDSKKVMKIVEALIRDNIFDKKQYETNGILTGEEIQNNFWLVARRRRKKQPILDIHRVGNSYSNESQEDNKTPKTKHPDNEASGLKTCQHDDASNPVNPPQNENPADKNGKMSRHFDKGEENRGDKKRENIILGRGSIARTREENARLEKWKKEMLEDEDWCATLVRFSGKGLAALEHAAEAIEIFFDLLLLRDEKAHQESLKEFKLHFVSWWRYNNFTMDMNELRTGKKTLPTRRIERRKPESKFEAMEKTCAEAQKMVKEMMGL